MTRILEIIFLSLLLFGISCSRVWHQADEKVETYQISSQTPEVISDQYPVELLIKPYRDQLQVEMEEVIGLLTDPLEKRKVESTMGNWVTDAVLIQAKRMTHIDYDFAICNYGGLRIPQLPSGPLRRSQLYELMPFDNQLVSMELPGSVVQSLFDLMASEDGWPISQGVQYTIRNGKPEHILIEGKPLDLEASYKVILSDYLAEGGGDCDFLKALPYHSMGILYRDAMIEYSLMSHQIGKSMTSVIEGRVIKQDL